MGITPNLVVGTWVGGDERHIRFLNINYGQGSYMARPFFSKFLTSIEANAEELGFENGAKFEVPAGAESIEFNCANVPYGGYADDEFGSDPGSNFGGDPFGSNPLGGGLPNTSPFGTVDPFGSGDPFGDEIKPVDTLDQ